MSGGNDFLMGVPRFTARFDSDCWECCREICEGDVAGYIDNMVCCERCCNGAEYDNEP